LNSIYQRLQVEMLKLKRLLLVFLLFSLQIKAQVVNGDGSVYIENIVVTENQECVFSGSFAKNIDVLGSSFEGVNNMYFASIEKGNKLDFLYSSLLSISSIEYSNGRLYVFGDYYRFTKIFGLRLGTDGRYKSFLASYNIRNKRLEWYHNFEGGEDVKSSQLCVDNNENVYVCGSYEDNVIISNKELDKLADRNIYIAAFNKEGENLWIEDIAAGDNLKLDSKEIMMCTDRNSHLYLSFNALGEIACGNMNTQTTTLSVEEENSLYSCENILAEYTIYGECLMLQPFITQASVKEMKYLDKQLIFGGYYTGEKDLGKNYAVSVFGDDYRLKANFNESRSIIESPFIASFTVKGEVNWTYTIPSENIVKVEALDVDKNGNVYVSAFYFNEIMLEGKTFHTLGDGFYSDAFLLKLDSNGKLLDYTVFEGVGHNVFSDIVVQNDILYVGGSFYKEFSDGTTTYISDNEYMSAILFQYKF